MPGLGILLQEGDALWKASDDDLAARATQELAHLGLAGNSAVVDAKVVRVPKAYPVYDAIYRRGLAVVREFLADVPNLQLVGRNGMHRYNNQDHSMLTAILAARNVLGASHNLWNLEVDSGYLEAGPDVTSAQIQALEESQPRVPRMVASA